MHLETENSEAIVSTAKLNAKYRLKFHKPIQSLYLAQKEERERQQAEKVTKVAFESIIGW
jgi:hypothetical protein